jgi:signal transduction histidine kinase
MNYVKKYRKVFTLFFGLCFFYINAQTPIDELLKKSFQEFKIGKYDDALVNSMKALRIAEKNKNYSLMAFANMRVGTMFYYNKEKKQALSYYFKSKNIIDSFQIDSLRIKILHNIGAIYTEFGKSDSALFFLNQSKALLEKEKNYGQLSQVNAVISELFMQTKKDFISADKYIGEAEKFAQLSKDTIWMAFALVKRSIYFRNKKEFTKALAPLYLAQSYYSKIGYIEGRLYVEKLILDILVFIKSDKVATQLKIYATLKDSVYRAEGANKIAQYKTLYETEKKEIENKFLQQENIIKQTKINARNKTIIGLIISILLIVIVIIWRINVNQLKKKQRELETTQQLQKEKERISRDLHDNVGGQLSFVLYSLDGITEENKDKRNEVVTDINKSVRQVISNLRETIWAINDETISFQDFADRLKVYSKSIFKLSATQINFKETIQVNRTLNSLVGLNLFRICQEIINNSFKHAQATLIEITFNASDNTTVTITDNGKGFDWNEITEGYGLKNIRSRAKETGILVEITSKENHGVTYKLIV